MGPWVPSYRRSAIQRSALAGMIGIGAVYFGGPLLLVPAVALVAFVYFVHHVVAAFVLGREVPYADVAFVIALNSLIILGVQGLVFLASLRPG